MKTNAPLPEVRPVTLFDLDGVFTYKDTMGSLVAGQLFRKPWRLIPAMVLLAAAGLSAHNSSLRPWAHRGLVAVALHSLTEEHYELLAVDTARSLAADESVVNVQAVQLALGALETGRVVVVTGSERRLAREFLNRVGLGHAELIASELSFPRGNARLLSHMVGGQKVRGVRMRGLDPAAATLYTDSASDLSLARVVRDTKLVNPDPKTLKSFQAQSIPTTVLRFPRQKP